MDRAEHAGRAVAGIVANLHEAAGRLRRLGDRIARSGGQTQARCQTLGAIAQKNSTVPRIADRLGVTRQSVQQVADELVEAGLAAWRENHRHRRSALLALTPRGRSALAELTKAAGDFNLRLAEAIGEPSLEALATGLERMLVSLRRDGETARRRRAGRT